ncbi:MAG: S8 family serine peptidase [Patescibacteria group bacterium]
MKHTHLFLSILFVGSLVATALPTPTYAAAGDARAMISSVRLADTQNTYFLVTSSHDTTTIQAFARLGLTKYEKNNRLGVFRLGIPKENQESVLIELKKDSSIVAIEADQKVSLSFTPNDPFLSKQTYLASSNIINAWDTSLGSPTVVVAVIDTGVDYFHEDLQGRLWSNASGQFGYDFVNKDTDPMDDHGHGTNIAGIIGANISNGIGIAGIGNVKIMALKSMNTNGDGFASDIAEAVYFAADNGARIVNLSLGLPESTTVLDKAVQYAYTKGTIVIAATGNKGVKKIDSPANHPLAVGVGALNSAESVAEFTNYGPELDLMAMGENVFAPTWSPTNLMTLYQQNNRGTSFAAPQVSGTAALILSRDPSLSADQLRKRLIISAKKIPGMQANEFSERYGYGKIDAGKAVTFDTVAPTVTASAFTLGNGVFQITGNAKDDSTTSSFLPDVTTSNINQIRYQVDGGEWQIVKNTAIASSIPVNILTANLSTANHVINIEATDTSGNTGRKTLETKDATVGAISNVANDYKATLVSQSPYPSISPAQKVNMVITYKNTGASLWTRDKVHLGTSKAYDRNSQFADSSWLSGNRIAMKEAVVAPGDLAHFEFTMTGPTAFGQFKEYFALVSEGVAWFSDIGLYWVVNSEKPSYHAQFVTQSPFTIVNRGDTRTMWVEYKNTGSQAWNDSNVALGTANPLDRTSPFYTNANGSGWKSANRIKMEKNSVQPGESSKFSFTIKAPETPGVYTEYFRPVVDGVGWMEDYGLYWSIAVQ